MRTTFVICLSLLAGIMSTFAQISITNTNNYTQVLNSFVLSGVTVSNPVFTGDSAAIGTFSNGSSTNIGMSNGFIMTTGRIDTIPSVGDTATGFLSFMNGTPGDALLGTLVTGAPLFDAAVFEFDVIPVGNMMEFKYVFASEEYPEFAGSAFNDVFGFFISGIDPAGGNYTNMNIALLPGSGAPVCINNVNHITNSQYYVDNQTGTSIIFDGFTTVLTAQAPVVAGTSYHLKLAVSDVADGIFDSGIFLKAQSLKSYVLTGIQDNQPETASLSGNPVSLNSVYHFNNDERGQVSVVIIDHTGKQVYSATQQYGIGAQQFALGAVMNNFTPGIYFMIVETASGRDVQKVVVNR